MSLIGLFKSALWKLNISQAQFDWKLKHFDPKAFMALEKQNADIVRALYVADGRQSGKIIKDQQTELEEEQDNQSQE